MRFSAAKSQFRILQASAALVAVAACSYSSRKGGTNAPPSQPPVDRRISGPSFEQVRTEVLAPRCTSCHHHASHFIDYRSTLDAIKDITQRVFVDRDMPKSGTLTPEQSALLKRWIDSGANEQAVEGEPITNASPNPSPNVSPPVEPIEPLEPTWENIQKKFFGAHCLRCHSGSSDPDLSQYEAAQAAAKEITDRVLIYKMGTRGQMPPKTSAREQITADQRELLIRWFQAGMPGPAAPPPTPEPSPAASSPVPAPAPAPSSSPEPTPVPNTSPSPNHK